MAEVLNLLEGVARLPRKRSENKSLLSITLNSQNNQMFYLWSQQFCKLNFQEILMVCELLQNTQCSLVHHISKNYSNNWVSHRSCVPRVSVAAQQ